MPARRRAFLVSLVVLFAAVSAIANDDIQSKFNRKYRDFLSRNSQSQLPLPSLPKLDWQRIVEARPLKTLYVEPDKFYNNKTYTFTMYQATEDGSYYLDAKGGFWGMEELVYGPFGVKELE